MWSSPHSGGWVLIEARLKLLSFLFWLAFEWRRTGNVEDGRSKVCRSTGLSLPHERFGQAHLTARRLSLLTASTPREREASGVGERRRGACDWPASQVCTTFVTASVDITWRCVYYVALIYLWARYKRISILFVWPSVASLCFCLPYSAFSCLLFLLLCLSLSFPLFMDDMLRYYLWEKTPKGIFVRSKIWFQIHADIAFELSMYTILSCFCSGQANIYHTHRGRQ